jgi:gamma-glutamylcysteine synthetase
MAGKLPALRGEVPTLSDWENHVLTTIYPEVNIFTHMHITTNNIIMILNIYRFSSLS